MDHAQEARYDLNTTTITVRSRYHQLIRTPPHSQLFVIFPSATTIIAQTLSTGLELYFEPMCNLSLILSVSFCLPSPSLAPLPEVVLPEDGAGAPPVFAEVLLAVCAVAERQQIIF